MMDAVRLLTRGSGFKFADSKGDQISTAQTTSSIPPTDSTVQGKKRKRAEIEQSSNGNGRLSIDELRRIQVTHKIKITDLKTLHQQNHSEDQKRSKEASRIFPQPLLHFSALKDASVNHSLIENIADQGYEDPTEVQIATIPLLVSQADQEPNLLTIAPTGSGKTLAFMIPLINKISGEHRNSGSDPVQRHVGAIILAPTKELAIQIVNEGRKLAVKTGVQITAFKKGMRLHEEVDIVDDQSLESSSDTGRPNLAPIVKADIIVSTPLTLLHSLTPISSAAPLPLPRVTNLVLDEADVLLDPLFRDQTLAVWSSCTNQNLRTSFWSATIGSNIEELVLSTIKEREGSKKHKKQRIPLLRCVIGLKDSSLPNIEHKLIYAATESGKLTGIRQILRPPPSMNNEPLLRPPFLVFTQTIPRAQSLYSELLYDIPPSATTETPRIAVLHSSLSSTQRSKIMQNFRLGKIWVLITTDLLSRGVDFRGVNGVINYDIPTTSASYVHRAGRTGRAGREGGVCITLYTREDILYLRPLVNLIRKAQKSHRNGMSGAGNDEDAPKPSARTEVVPIWLLNSLPHLSKEKRKDLKMRGVEVRRGLKQSDVKSERRSKNRNMIGTKCGYDQKLEDRRRGMVEGSKRRSSRNKHSVSDDEDVASDLDVEFAGFD